MKRILITLSLLVSLTAYAAPKARTAAQWAELCKNAIPAKALRTAQLVMSKGVAPIKATLAAAGLSNFKEETVPDVLVLHDNGTCAYDNRGKFYQITRRPHRDDEGNFVIGDYRDGAYFEDPSRKLPEGTMWGAKRTGVPIYLPAQYGACDRDLATCKDAYQTALTALDALKEQIAIDSIATAIPASPVTMPVAPVTSVVVGTVKRVENTHLRLGFMMIAAACGLGVFWLMRRYKEQIAEFRNEILVLLNDLETAATEIATCRRELRRVYNQNEVIRTEHAERIVTLAGVRHELGIAVKTIALRDEEVIRLGRCVSQIQGNLDGERAAAAATQKSADAQLAEVRAQREVAEENLSERTAAFEHVVTRANNLADDLRAAQNELSDAQRELTGVHTALHEAGERISALEYAVTHANNLADELRKALGEDADLAAIAAQDAQNIANALRKECNRLRDQLAVKKVELDLADRTMGIEQRVGDLNTRMGQIEPIAAALRTARAEQEVGEPWLDYVEKHPYARPTSAKGRQAREAFRRMCEAVRGIPMPATA